MGIWAVRFWFGEFQEQAVCTPNTDRKRERVKETRRKSVEKRLNTHGEVSGGDGR